MQKKRYYLDTSVWVGAFQRRVVVETRLFLDMVLKTNGICLHSKVVDGELIDKSKDTKKLFAVWPSEQKEKVGITSEVEKLADMYISQKVVGKTSRKDCLHIAAATIYQADMLVSWNFKHIVRDEKIKGYNSVNMGLGYRILDIHSPAEVCEYGY